MIVIMETHLIIDGRDYMRRGEFFVDERKFKTDPNFAVGIIAYAFIENQKAESGYKDTIIEKVIWDDQHDITELVKQIRPIDPVDDLPF